MSSNCQPFQDLIPDLLRNDLAQEDRLCIEEHIADCPTCRAELAELEKDDRLLGQLVESLADDIDRLENRIINRLYGVQPETVVAITDHKARLGARRWLRYAAAAVLASGLVLAWQLMQGPQSSSIAWAQIISQVENAEDFICRWQSTIITNHKTVTEGVRYKSKKWGTRDDLYQKDRLVGRNWWDLATFEKITVHYGDDVWMRIGHTKQGFIRNSMQSDAQRMVSSIKAMPYRELRSKRINGVLAAGIEVENPECFRGGFDHTLLRLWVDESSGWPVRIEIESSSDKGRLCENTVFSDFQWNPEIPAEIFEIEIPDDLELVIDQEAPVADEHHTIAALRDFAEITGGAYPDTLTWGTAASQALTEFKRNRRSPRDKVRDVNRLMQIRDAVEFVTYLAEEGSDPVYSGESTNQRDFDKILLRWRLEDGSYRVIYGDLRAETVSEERLTEIEAR
jgi:hypothetical protein